MITIKKILVPVDFSAASALAAHYGAFMAQAHRAMLYLLHVKEPFPVHGRIVAGSLDYVQKHRLEKATAQLSKVLPVKVKNTIMVEEIEVTGIPVHQVIVEKAEKLGADVIVMPAIQQKGIERYFKKNVTERVIRNSSCSVFLIKGIDKPAD